MKHIYSDAILELGFIQNSILFDDYTILAKIPDKEHAKNIVRILRSHDELLEAAKQFLTQVRMTVDNRGFKTMVMFITPQFIEKLEQAIQKAESK